MVMVYCPKQYWIMPEMNAEVMERPARQALERGRKTLEQVLRKARPREVGALQSTTNEVTFLIEAARLAVESGLAGADAVERDFNEARLRGLSRIAEFLQGRVHG